MDAKEKVSIALCQLLFEQPFFGTLALQLKKIEDKTCPTMATDGKRLLYGPKFVDSLPIPVIRTILAHEVLHCALLHPTRRGMRNPKKWNIACDYVINEQLQELNEKSNNQPFPFPEGKLAPLLNKQYRGMMAEQVYDLLPDDPDSNGKGDGSDFQGGMGDVMDPERGEDSKQIETDWQIATAQAAELCKKQGTLPSSMERLVQELLNPPPRWQDILRRWVRDIAKDDYSFTRPNSRYAHTGFILPSLYSQRIGRIAVAIDTSGSITPELLNVFLSEVEGILHEVKPRETVVFDCDAEIHHKWTLDTGDPVPRDFTGGGGTCFRPVFEALETEERPDCLIYFTDLHGSFPDSEPGYPVLWVTYGEHNGKHPWGELVPLN
jgi:predicted metal-dependent peptidase